LCAFVWRSLEQAMTAAAEAGAQEWARVMLVGVMPQG
jgi:hypothetical protein